MTRLGAEATQFLEEIDPPAGGGRDPVNPLILGADRYRLFFRIVGEETMTPQVPPSRRLAPLIRAQVDIVPGTGGIVGYRYDLIDPAYDAHYGYHLHGHGGPAFAHIQGCHRAPRVQAHPIVTFGEVVNDLIRECFEHRYPGPPTVDH